MASKITDIIQRIDGKLHANRKLQFFDFIGDVHGHANELEMLLSQLGYQLKNNVWYHSNYKAVFVGDFISRGPESRKVLKIVRSMVENKSAYAILGNHEINAICYFTKRQNGLPIRIPGPANKKMLDKIKGEYPNIHELENDIKWLRKLPLYYDFKYVRVVHAYWSNSHIELLNGAMPETKLKRKFLREVFRGGTAISKAFMQTIKGVEFCFPHNLVIKDNLGIRRVCYRVKWWQTPNNKTFEELSFETKLTLPNDQVPLHLVSEYEVYGPNEPPVFIGHYCTETGQSVASGNVCCVDTCVAGGGPLSAYRWEGERALSGDKVRSVGRTGPARPQG
ncbi:MAG: metallophosphoesterase [Breznakibacter sp.]